MAVNRNATGAVSVWILPPTAMKIVGTIANQEETSVRIEAPHFSSPM
jgi:hypothetical protein